MTAPKAKIATIEGTFINPGWSKNNRFYSREAIGRAVDRMKEAIASGSGPVVTQLTSHDDKSILDTVGKITDVWVNENGGADYKADAPDTSKARDLVALLAHQYAGPVSIAGNWVGDTRQFESDGRVGETGDDLDIARVDYVFAGGVKGAQTRSVVLAEGVPETAFTDEVHGSAELAAEAEPRSVIAENQPANTPVCTKHAATEAAVGTALAGDKQAFNPLIALDPDQDGDIDAWACPTCGAVTPNDDPESNPDGDNQMESRKEPAVAETTPAAAAVTEDKPAEQEPVAETAPARTLTEADVAAIKAAFAETTPETPAAPVEEVAPLSTAPAALTEADVQQRIDEMKAGLVKEIVESYGPPPRKGFVRAGTNEAKSYEEMSLTEKRAYEREVWNAQIPDPPGARVIEPATT